MLGATTPSDVIPPEYAGWWRITETGTWVNDSLDARGCRRSEAQRTTRTTCIPLRSRPHARAVGSTCPRPFASILAEAITASRMGSLAGKMVMHASVPGDPILKQFMTTTP